MAPTLYGFSISPYSRAVELTARALDLDLDMKIVNLMKQEHLKPEFVAINPQHTIPTLVDGDLVLTESRAISTYLVSRYGKDDTLYPKDVVTRAKIDSLLYFDCSTLCVRWRAVVYPVMRSVAPKPSEEALKALEEAIQWLDGKLEKNPDGYLAGTAHPTVADIAVAAWLSNYEAAGFPLASHPRLVAWLTRVGDNVTGFKEINEAGAAQYGEMFKGMLKERS